jgi:hypothetical protein
MPWESVTAPSQLCAELGRDRAGLRLAVALRSPQAGDVGALAELGVDELVLVQSSPERADDATEWVSALADQWMRPVAQ